MKIKKIALVGLLDVFIAVTYPAIQSISAALAGASSLKGITESTVIFLIIFNVSLFLFLLFVKKTKSKNLLIGSKVITSTLLIVYTVTVLFVPLSSPFDILSLCFKLNNPETAIRSVYSEDIGDNRYLEIIEKDNIYECFIVRKKFFAFCHDNHGHNYYWDNNKIDAQTSALMDNIPKFFENDRDSIIIYSALSDDVDKAYIDGNEMKVVSDGTIRLAYYIIEGKSINSTELYLLTKQNKNGDVLYQTKL